MKTNGTWKLRLAQILLGAVIAIALVVVRGTNAGNQPVHLTTDWSHRHLVFSPPRNLMEQFKFSSNARYVQQWIRRNAGQQGDPGAWRWRRAAESPETLNGDWSMNMGPGATVGAGNYPAKYSFDATTAKCGSDANPDFVVYNTSLAGAAAADAHQIVTFGGTGASGVPVGSVTIGGTLTLTATAGASGGLNFHVVADNSAGNRTANATSLTTAINLAGNGSSVGVSAGSAAGVVTITATTGGTAGNSITLTTTLTNGVTVGGATLAGGVAAQASIIAFDNLYSGCASGTVPSTYWAYNTGGTVVTSPTLSGDGTQVAFVETIGAVANLVLLKWAESGTATYNNPVALTSQASAAAYQTCTAPCMYTIAFNGGTADTTSSPFYDFAPGSDTLYVGDASGKLHKFNPVFKGAPGETITGGYPFTMASAPLSSPVYDEGSGLVLANAAFSTTNNGGRLHTLCATVAIPSCGTVGVTTVATGLLGPSTAGMTCQSPAAGGTSGDGANLLLDAPIVDPSNKTVYIVIGNDSTGSSALYEFPEVYTAGSCGTEIKLGTGTTSNPAVPVYAGNFDNLYYTGSAGHLYVCGNAGGDPTLYQITVSALGIISGTPNTSAALTNGATTCGPVTEVYNPGTNPPSTANDWIFTSVEASGQTASPISCPTNTGCIMSFNVTSGAAISVATATVGHTAVAGGASGVIVDNTVGTGTLAGASQIYFTPLAVGGQVCTTSGGTGGCAIQASQAAIN